MFKYVLKYTDYLDNEQEDTLRFNLSETEMLDLVKNDPAFDIGNLKRMVDEANGLDMIDTVRKLIVLSYGVLSDDGKKFRKNNDITMEFVQSAAYDALIEKFIDGKGDTEFAKNFMLGIFPKKYAERIKGEADKITALPGSVN